MRPTSHPPPVHGVVRAMTVNGPMTRSNGVTTLGSSRRSFRRVGTSGRHGRSWRSCRRVGSAEVPRPANNCAPVAPRLLTLTDHPGFDLVAIFIRMGDRDNGCYSPSGLVMEVPPFHDTLRMPSPTRCGRRLFHHNPVGNPYFDRTFPARCDPLVLTASIAEETRMAKKRKRKYSRGAGTDRIEAQSELNRN